LALRADEGRSKQRYFPGELQASFDPRDPEWGNLAPVTRCYLLLNQIGRLEASGRNETS
jgi:hypothetical protein